MDRLQLKSGPPGIRSVRVSTDIKAVKAVSTGQSGPGHRRRMFEARKQVHRRENRNPNVTKIAQLPEKPIFEQN